MFSKMMDKYIKILDNFLLLLYNEAGCIVERVINSETPSVQG